MSNTYLNHHHAMVGLNAIPVVIFYVMIVCVQYAVHKAIKKDHPDLQDSWMEVTYNSSPESVYKIPVGHFCQLKEKKVKLLVASMSMSTAPIITGSTHYYQYMILLLGLLCMNVLAFSHWELLHQMLLSCRCRYFN
jgi:hypothetical protein